MDDFKELERKWLNKKKQKEWRETHKEQVQICHKKYYDKNKDKINAKRRAYIAKNRDRERKRSKEYRLTHPESYTRAKLKMKEWQQKNQERVKAYHKKYYQTHPREQRISKIVKGVKCRCGFSIKCRSRYSSKKKIKCPACRKSYHPIDLEKIIIQREGYKSVFDIQKEKKEKQEFEELIQRKLIEKQILSK